MNLQLDYNKLSRQFLPICERTSKFRLGIMANLITPLSNFNYKFGLLKFQLSCLEDKNIRN